ncbi:hypothetical protein KVR01_010142 [Diaporthe batatas]|uniref:uncharacterized protein n=1 Tax=Diaporthe batatas TaxID=748121 RepID=UPI001D040C01|nr:uncharacterized protein KVR01_010142 [Diaporthe batatas]KAG8159505.1 hypothetical protein KVR01_010142 [Diaporthe batatas]
MTPHPSSAFAVGVVILFARWAIRIRTVGFRGLRGDDLISIPLLALWTINAFGAYTTYYSGSNFDVTAEQAEQLSDSDVWVLEYGGKWQAASIFTYSAIIWCLKFMVLFFYRRLNADQWNQSLWTHGTGWIFYLNGIAYIAVVFVPILVCKEFHNNWVVRPLHHCPFSPWNVWIPVSVNIFTDELIMTIPVPILCQSRVSTPRKIGIMLLLCLVGFVISAAVVRAKFTIAAAPSVTAINRWGFRETGAGMIVVNAPVVMPIFSKAFWKRGPYRPGRQEEQPHGGDILGGGGDHGNGRRASDAPGPTASQVPTDVTETTQGASHGTGESIELRNLGGRSGPGNNTANRDLEQGPDTTSEAVEARSAGRRVEDEGDGPAVSATRIVG